MIPVEQDRFSPEEGGNCFAACIASLLECPLSEVPQLDGAEGVTQEGYDAYRSRLYAWLEDRGLKLLYFDFSEKWTPSGYAILSTESTFAGFEHAVVALDGQIVWDPHPLRERGVGKWLGWLIFQSLDPSRHS